MLPPLLASFPPEQVASIVEAATAELLDNGVFNATKSVSSASGRGKEKQTRRPQLLSVGPVRVEAGATFLTLAHGESSSRELSGDGSFSGSLSGSSSGKGEGSGEGPLEAPACPRLGSEVRIRAEVVVDGSLEWFCWVRCERDTV